uniref:BZIP domain-containing protein n=1 Tax=Leptocylindrus danicus TaxID=163516 RepID=A0A7S2JZF7_9STRA|mmetsp:Transcript_14049/g.20790  ORF Transcript_14049/g.20790 Transcript_14049/m.20790 type:complete len:214 (+) Transcript_14049:102-743(+)
MEEQDNTHKDTKLPASQRVSEDQGQREDRLAANRKAARESRRRKKILIEELQRKVIELSGNNAELTRENQALRNELAVARQQISVLVSSSNTLNQFQIGPGASAGLTGPNAKIGGATSLANGLGADQNPLSQLQHAIALQTALNSAIAPHSYGTLTSNVNGVDPQHGAFQAVQAANTGQIFGIRSDDHITAAMQTTNMQNNTQLHDGQENNES